MRERGFGRISAAALALALGAAPSANAQTPEQALSGSWDAICAGAAPASQLAARCSEIFAGGAGSRDIAAEGNFLDELPGQGRSSTREGGQREQEQRTQINAHVSLWASADGGRLTRKQGPNEGAFHGDTNSISVGVDWMPDPHWVLGVALSHNEEKLDFQDSRGNAKGRYTGGLGYLSWNPGDTLSLNGYVGTLEGSNDLLRAIDYTLPDGTHVAATALADPDSRRTLAGLGADWTVPQGKWGWNFGAGVDYMRTQLDAYQESGGNGLAIAVPQRVIVTRRGRLDATLTRTVSTSWGVWQPQFKLGLRHEFANPARALTVRFIEDAGATPVVFDTEDPDANWGEWALGSAFVFTHGHSGFIQYRQRFGHAFLQERVLALGWRIELK
jgi:outer membrane autotransporter protein